MNDALAIIPRDFTEVQTFAEVLAKSALLPEALRGKAADVVVQILAGRELGLSPMAAIRGIHLIQGKPVLAADTMVAIVLGSGLCEYFMCVEETDAGVTYETKRKGTPKPQRSSWSIEDSKRAALNTKENHRLYPRAMMRSRCKAALARDAYPDVLAGVYDPDELDVVGSRSVAITPTPTSDIVDAEIVTSVSDDPAVRAPATVSVAINGVFATYLDGMAKAGDLADLDRVAAGPGRPPKGTAEHKTATAVYLARKDELEGSAA